MDWNLLFTRATALGREYGPKLLGVILLLVFGWILAGWVGRWTANGLKKARVDTTLSALRSRFARWGMLILVFIGCFCQCLELDFLGFGWWLLRCLLSCCMGWIRRLGCA